MDDAAHRTVNVLWAGWDGRGLEHLRLDVSRAAVRADSLILAVDDAGLPFRARYVIECDVSWKVTRARIEVLEEPGRVLDLRTDGHGHWTDAARGEALSLNRCVDVDIFPSPFTNTLPIRRLGHAVVGRPNVIEVAWVALPELSIQAVQQEYTLLGRDAEGSRWRFRALDSGFTAELAADGRGVVLDYLGLARRVM